MNNTLLSDVFSRYIRPRWKQQNLQTYVFISRLKTDTKFRREWIKRRIQKEEVKNPKDEKQLLNDFINDLDLVPMVNVYDKPVIRILPKRFRGMSCQNILDINLKHLTTCLSLIVDEAAERIIRGYGIVNVLGSVFGDEYKKMVTQYVIKRLNGEPNLKNGKR
jgi:hypothetical protein